MAPFFLNDFSVLVRASVFCEWIWKSRWTGCRQTGNVQAGTRKISDGRVGSRQTGAGLGTVRQDHTQWIGRKTSDREGGSAREIKDMEGRLQTGRGLGERKWAPDK